MKGMRQRILTATILALLCACSLPEAPGTINAMLHMDHQVPVLEELSVLDRHDVTLTFNEEVEVLAASFDGLEAEAWPAAPGVIQVHSSDELPLSHAAQLFISVRDKAWNSSALSIPVSGRNNDIPSLVINEFSSKGTETQPDRIELEIRGEGNLEGICVMDGTKGNEKHSFILPDIDVERGDYVVIWWDSVPDEEVQENDDGSTVFNLAASSKEGLATNNGVFVVYRTPSGDDDVIDALVYTNGESTSYSGFGSARVEASYNGLTASFDWMGPAFNSRHSTSTRTVSRRNIRMDTDSASDFYITVTRGQTFGRMNSSAEYVPEEKTASGPGDVF